MLFLQEYEELGIFLEDHFWIYSHFQRYLVRQWIHVSSSPWRLLYSDPSIDSRPALFFRVQRTAWSSVVHFMRQSTERNNFMFFYVKRWITDPEVDSRLSEHVLRSLVSDSHLFVASPDEYMIWIFWEMTSGINSMCSALGSTVDTCMASVYEVWRVSLFFLRERELGS